MLHCGGYQRTRRTRSTSSFSLPTRRTEERLQPRLTDRELSTQYALAAARLAFNSAAKRKVEISIPSQQLVRRNSRLSAYRSCVRPSTMNMESGPTRSHARHSYGATSNAQVSHSWAQSLPAGLARNAEEGCDNLVCSVQNPHSDVLRGDIFMPGEDAPASLPSSYRKLRKSKSLFNPGKTLFYPARDSNLRSGIQSRGFSTSTVANPSLSTCKSTSFLRGGMEFLPSGVRRQQYRDATIIQANERYQQEIRNQRLRKRTSFYDAVSHRPFRRTVRNSSLQSHGIGTPPIDAENALFPDSLLSKKAREISISLKKTMKGLFLRSSKKENSITTIPPQQVTSTRPYFTNDAEAPTDDPPLYHEIPTPDNLIVSRVISRNPSIQTVPSHVHLRPRSGSIRSSSGSNNEAIVQSSSRVTSWADSAITNNTINRHGIQNAMERKRLSIIQETGGPRDMSNFNLASGAPEIDRYATENRVHLTSEQRPASRNGVDCQRIYSALIKRIDTNDPKCTVDEPCSLIAHSGGAINHETPSVPSRSVSVSSRLSIINARSPATLRKVDTSINFDEGSNNVPQCIFQLSQNVDYPVHEPKSNGLYEYPARHMLRASDVSENRGLSDYTLAPIYQPPVYRVSPTPQQIANQIEGLPVTPRPVIRNARSMFFPSSVSEKLTTPSPYKRALATMSNTAPSSENRLFGISPCEELNKNDSHHSEAGIPKGELKKTGCMLATVASSTYSRTTGGHSIRSDKSAIALQPSNIAELQTSLVLTSAEGKRSFQWLWARSICGETGLTWRCRIRL
jgi:hypothetical protein